MASVTYIYRNGHLKINASGLYFRNKVGYVHKKQLRYFLRWKVNHTANALRMEHAVGPTMELGVVGRRWYN